MSMRDTVQSKIVSPLSQSDQPRSLSGAEGSAHLEIVVDVAILGAGLQRHVCTGAVCTFNLHVDVG